MRLAGAPRPKSRLGLQVGCELADRVHVSRRRWPHTLFPLPVGLEANATPLGSHFLRIASSYLFHSAGPLLIYPPFLPHLLRTPIPFRTWQVKGQTAQYVVEVVTERVTVELRPVELCKPLRAPGWDAIEELCQTFADLSRRMVLKEELLHKR